MGEGLPRFQQDEDLGTLEAAARAPGYAHLGRWGWGKDGTPGGQGLPDEGGSPPQLACPDPFIRPSFPIPNPYPRILPMAKT